jgi:toxin FitB
MILPLLDGMIAATALVHDLTVVTRNIRGFQKAGARVFDPFA